MPEKRKPCRPYQLNTLGVCLFGRPFFPDEHDVCPRQWYNDVFEGKTDGWLTDTSFDNIQSRVEDYLRDVFPRLNTAKVTLNWALLIGAFFFGIVPGLLGLFIIFLKGDKSRVACKEMCKRAFDLEIEARQVDVPPEGREVDIVAHHLVCSYFETFQKDSWSLMNPVKWFNTFLKHQDVPRFCSRHTGLVMEEYELWSEHKQLAPAATQKAVEMLSRPRAGGSTRYVFTFVITLGLLIVSVVLSIVLDNDPPEQPEVSLTVGCTVIALYILGSFMYLWTWMPVARRIAGLVRPSTERWAAGSISKDPIHAVTDLAMLSILHTELDKERVYVPGMMYWHNIAPALSSERSRASRAASRASMLSVAHSLRSSIGSPPATPSKGHPPAAGLAAIRSANGLPQGGPGSHTIGMSTLSDRLVLRSPPSMEADLNTLSRASSEAQGGHLRGSGLTTSTPAVSAKVHLDEATEEPTAAELAEAWERGFREARRQQQLTRTNV